jgi:two-component system chemotaxis response regulator CheB
VITDRKIRVLVVDDSLLSRELIVRRLNDDPEIEVVARAADPFEARDKIIEFKPDVITCDIQMPKMDGIEFIQRLLPHYPIPVVVVSSISSAIFDALKAGAVEFVLKPNNGEETVLFKIKLIKRIKIASKANLLINNRLPEKQRPAKGTSGKTDLIVMGASTGGTEALHYIIKNLPSEMPGIVIVQHIPPVFSKMFADRLDTQTDFRVKEAQNGDIVERGCVYVAPGKQNIKIKKSGDKYKIVYYTGHSESRHAPSVDVLFESVAETAGKRAIGVILTGMGSDGAKGLLKMRTAGARTIGQDEKSSIVYGMPRVAYEIGAVEKRVGLSQIPGTILNMIT